MAKGTPKKFNADAYPYPECRGGVHIWRFYDGTIEDKSKLAYQVDKCETCPTKRYTVLSMRPATAGELFKPRTYSYPDDYHVEGGLDKSDKGKLRLRNFFDNLNG